MNYNQEIDHIRMVLEKCSTDLARIAKQENRINDVNRSKLSQCSQDVKDSYTFLSLIHLDTARTKRQGEI
jgi:hypothetical protein